MKKILILKSNRDEFERFFIKHMQTSQCDTKPYYKLITLKKFFRIVAIIWMQKLKLPFQSIWYGDWKKEINNYDEIIVFDRYWGDGILKYIHKKAPNARLICWYWNSLVKQTILKDKYRNFCECWSFDQKDVKTYSLKFNNMFYFYPQNVKNKLEFHAFFVGADKGRSALLADIANTLLSYNMKIKFVVIGKKIEDRMILEYQKENFDYNEYLKLIEKSKCMIEVLQKGQYGVTIRAIEALMYEKKLITTNKDIKNYDFYCKDNIFVWEEDKLENLEDFIRRPYKKINNQIKKKYAFENWLNNFEEASI